MNNAATLAYKHAEETVKKIEKVAEMAERQARTMNHINLYQRLLSLEVTKPPDATLPCNTLPVAENNHFFGRQ